MKGVSVRPKAGGGNTGGAAAAPRLWHALPAEDVLSFLQTDVRGLSGAEAENRLRVHGRNRLPRAAAPGAWRRLLRQFHNLLIYLLVGAAALSVLFGHPADAAVILAVVVLNAVIGFVQEGRAEDALKAIQALIHAKASVWRDGRRQSLDAEEIVPGDIVWLESGDRVPADLRLLRPRKLRIDEASLTGESAPRDKSSAPVEAEAPLAERLSMAYSGTLVAAGQGAGVAVATGADTELGRISALVGSVREMRTPLLRQMDAFAKRLTYVILSLAAGVFVFAHWVRDYSVPDAFMVVVGLAVAAIPEGLPAVMTITLAIGVKNMARRNAIIRRLPAVETLGSVTVICTDKTGTLTRNEMMVDAAVTAEGEVSVEGPGYAPEGAIRRGGRKLGLEDPLLARLGLAAILCNDAALAERDGTWTVEGDPMEGALLAFGAKAGLVPDEIRALFPRIDEIPFDAQHRYMASLHRGAEDGFFLYLKGAPEPVLSMCRCQAGPGGAEEPLDTAYWTRRTGALAESGRRVLAVAAKHFGSDMPRLEPADAESGLTFIGLFGLVDPPRPEAVAAVRECRSAGIRVIMITGDHAGTAGAVAAELGIGDGVIVTGRELDRLSPESFAKTARAAAVFARTSPEHKLRLVEALQAAGHVVAMTGDGVNDAPALKRADVGVAMGVKGTEAAKDAAEMVIGDDNFASIVAAVKEGRTVYDNLMKVVGWTLPTNGGESFAIIGAIAAGVMLPVTPLQILWINLVTAVALGLTLAFEPAEPGAMARPPRPPRLPILSRRLAWRIAFVSTLVMAGAFGLFYWALGRGLGLAEARTLVVNAIIIMEIFYLFSVRYVHGPSLTLRGVVGTPAVWTGLAAVVAAQLAFTYAPPLQEIFETRALAAAEGLAALGVGALLLLAVEGEKWLGRRFAGRRPT